MSFTVSKRSTLGEEEEEEEAALSAKRRRRPKTRIVREGDIFLILFER